MYQIDAGKIAIEQASDLFDKMINEKGLIFVNMLVVNEIKIDCPFFLPRRLIELEYFETDNSEIDEEYVRLTTEYADDIDFAFML